MARGSSDQRQPAAMSLLKFCSSGNANAVDLISSSMLFILSIYPAFLSFLAGMPVLCAIAVLAVFAWFFHDYTSISLPQRTHLLMAL